VLAKTNEAYKFWHSLFIQFPRISKYTLGAEIDQIFLKLIELIIQASYAQKNEKSLIVQNASIKLDTLKFLLQTAWELKLLDHKKYSSLSLPLSEIGKMLGGWLKYLEK
jgi:hypothetical protein